MMIRCPVCGKWFTDTNNAGMEKHILKKHSIRIVINKMSYEDIDINIRKQIRRKKQ